MFKRSAIIIGVVAGFFLFLGGGSVQAAPEIAGVTTSFFASSANVSWSATDPTDIYGANFEYGPSISYGQTSTIRSSITVTFSGAVYNFSSAISSLQSLSETFYKITVYSSNGQSATYSSSFIMPERDLKPPTISRIAVAAQSESATVSWVTDEPSDGRVEYYNGVMKSKTSSDLVTEHHIYLGNLKPDSSYAYKIESTDKDGNTAVTTERRFYTTGLLLPPNDVSGLRATVKDGRITLVWTNPAQNDFDHITVVRSPGSPVTSPEDGEEIYKGTAENYSGALPNAKYYYTVFSFNKLGRHSGGATVEVSSGAVDADAPPMVTVSSTQHLALSLVKFYTDRRSRELVPVNGVLSDRGRANFSIGIPASSLSYTPESIQVRIAGGELHQFAQPSGQNYYFADFSFPLGRKSAFVQINYANGLRDVIAFQLESVGEIPETRQPTLSETVKKPVEVKTAAPVITPIKETAAAIKDFAASEEVQQTVSTVVAPTIVGVAAVTTITTISWVNLLPFLQLLIFQPFVLLGRRRRFSYGQVYDSLNKLPVDLAVVRLINKATGTLAQSKVTDKEGRYAFVVNPGTYLIQVIKGGFLFPSRLLMDVKVDGQKIDIYHGEPLTVTAADAVIAANIPLDPAGQYHSPPVRILWQAILRRLQIAFSWVGLAVIIFSLYVSPKWYTAVLLLVHLFSLLVLKRLASPPKTKNWGIVYDARTRQPITKAVARLYNAHLNRLVASQITDAKGRYFFLAGDDTYYLTFEHPNYSSGKTTPINLKGKKSESIAVDFGLTPGASS